MKIICVGHNYKAHNKELNSDNPAEPVIFMKPDSALLKNNKPFFIPDFTKDLHHEVELVIKINRLGKNISPRFTYRYYSEVGLGIDFTARDLQNKFRAEGKPWEICKAFDNSAVIGDFIPVEQINDIQNIGFHLEKNGQTVQEGNSCDMIFPVDELIAYISKFFTLKIGDLIFTGTPAGVGPVCINDKLEGFIFEKKMFSFYVK